MPLATILEAFMQCHQCDPHYFLTDLQTHLFLANRLGQYEEQLSITDTFTLASSPIKINDEDLLASFDYVTKTEMHLIFSISMPIAWLGASRLRYGSI